MLVLRCSTTCCSCLCRDFLPRWVLWVLCSRYSSEALKNIIKIELSLYGTNKLWEGKKYFNGFIHRNVYDSMLSIVHGSFFFFSVLLFVFVFLVFLFFVCSYKRLVNSWTTLKKLYGSSWRKRGTRNFRNQEAMVHDTAHYERIYVFRGWYQAKLWSVYRIYYVTTTELLQNLYHVVYSTIENVHV